MTYNMPLYWGSPEADDSNSAAPQIDPNDRDMVALVQTITNMSKSERSLALLILRAVAIWSGMKNSEPETSSDRRFRIENPASRRNRA
jgi:hypothetical protein